MNRYQALFIFYSVAGGLSIGVQCTAWLVFFRNQNNRPRKLMLNIPEIGRHVGAVVTNEIYDILKKFEIEIKIGVRCI
jgi:hypothetical protein